MSILFGRYLESYFEKEIKIDYTKIDTVDLEPPCQEFSVHGLQIAVALWFVPELIFRARLLGEQSSCMPKT